jgi:mannose-6-phosphate isomerase-like protein (cupin superfamily)
MLRIMPRTVLDIGLVALCMSTPAISFAQSHPKPTVATDITDQDVKEVLKHAPPAVDQQLKVVDVGPYNVGVGIVHRGPSRDSTDGTTPCIIHHNQTETYIIVDGTGTLVTGGTIMNPKEIPPESQAYKVLNGPSANGTVRDSEAQVRNVKAGDIVIIPPDVCHGWKGIADHVNYLSVRPDPDRVLPAGYVNPAIQK